MHFTSFIKDYSQKIVLRRGTGHLDRGKYVDDGEQKYYIEVAVMHLTPEDIRYYEGGNYTTQDLKIFAPEELEAENIDTGEKTLVVLKQEDIIEFEGKDFEVREPQNNTHLMDFHHYAAKKVVVK